MKMSRLILKSVMANRARILSVTTAPKDPLVDRGEIVPNSGNHSYKNIEYERPKATEIETLEALVKTTYQWQCGADQYLSALSIDRLILLLGYALLEQVCFTAECVHGKCLRNRIRITFASFKVGWSGNSILPRK